MKKKRTLSFKAQSYIAGYTFIALPIIGILLFTFMPLVFSLYVSFNEYDFFTGEFTHIGFANFNKAFKDPYFIVSLQNTGLTLLGLGDKNVAMLSMIMQGVWMGIGGGMVMYIAALKNAPKSLYEAAEIDGANDIQKFFKITIPMISPTTFYILVTSLIGTMTDFTRFKLMTDGGPYYSTLTSALYIYQTAFTQTYSYDYSYATSMSWILSILIILLVGGVFLTSKKWVHYND